MSSTKIKLLVSAFICSTLLASTPSLASVKASLELKKGDAHSAGSNHALLSRLIAVQKGFQSPEDLDGAWLCKTSTPFKNDDPRCEEDGLLYSKEGVLTFNASTKTWSYYGAGGTDGVATCGMSAEYAPTGDYDVRSNRLILEGSPFGYSRVNIYPLTKVSPTLFRWDGVNSSIVECQKTQSSTLGQP